MNKRALSNYDAFLGVRRPRGPALVALRREAAEEVDAAVQDGEGVAAARGRRDSYRGGRRVCKARGVVARAYGVVASGLHDRFNDRKEAHET